jgi:hypothetical protein
MSQKDQPYVLILLGQRMYPKFTDQKHDQPH